MSDSEKKRGRGRPRKAGPKYLPKLVGKGPNKAMPVQIVKATPVKATSSNSLYPVQRFCTLEYSRGYGLTSNTTQNNFGAGSVSYFLNSIFSPESTSGLYNVQGYDQIKDIYNKYKVYGCKVRITFSNATQDGLYVGVRAHESGSTDYLGGETIGYASMKKWTWSSPLQNTGEQKVIYERYWDIQKMEGLTKGQFVNDIDKYHATMGSRPQFLPYLETCLGNSADTTAASCTVKIEMTFYTQLYGKKILPLSSNS